jgi:hypothetical protein
MPTARRPAATPAARLPHVQAIRKPDGRVYLYYRRDGRRTPLPGPEGSLAFLGAYDAIHAAHAANPRPAGGQAGTVAAAITAYLASPDVAQLAESSRRNYRWTLDRFRGAFGPMLLRDLDAAWWEALRARHTGRANEWNLVRSRMRDVIRLHRRLNPRDLDHDPLAEVPRIGTPKSHQNRDWPHEALARVMRAATPEFRALLICYLLTAQRGCDVTSLPRQAYDAKARTLRFVQQKTGVEQVLHVPAPLAAALATMEGRHPTRLLATPRGEAWTTSNAQETLRRMLSNLGLPRYTLHGLRATGPTALVMAGEPNRVGRALTGHQDDATYEHYTRGAAGYDLARQAAEALDRIFGQMVTTADATGNQTRATGPTGRAATKARSALATDVATGNKRTRPKPVSA